MRFSEVRVCYTGKMHDTLLVALGSENAVINDDELKAGLRQALVSLGPRNRVAALPPDGTRAHARAGVLTQELYSHYRSALSCVMPALGTHRPMAKAEFQRMFPGVPHELHRAHEWRKDLALLGQVPSSFVERVSEGACSFEWPAQVNRHIVEGGYDLIVSIGQVVPHEVVGMANHAKNLFVGAGGREAINRSHWLGAAYGIERVLGRRDTPVRAVLDYSLEHFARDLPMLWVLTVVEPLADGATATRGLFIGTGRSCFERASALSARVNIRRLPMPLMRAAVWLDPSEFGSTWLGNKAIYRTRMAMADGGKLLILAPGIDRFGEDGAIDALIRRYGYRGTKATMALVESGELAESLAAAAHLIHGSTEGRFSVTLAAGGLSRREVENVGYEWADFSSLSDRYNPGSLLDGWNDGEDGSFYFIRNPALGLWSARELD